MTSAKPMRIEELLELAALDAYGLLDDYEAELYTRSFHHAPVAVQDEILRIQAEVAADQSILPADMPAPDLRERVLNAVARAIEEDARELAPLASIGQRFSIASPPATDSPRLRLTLSGQFWRAVALVMIGVSIVLGWFGAEARQKAIEISEYALQNNTSGQLEEMIGPTYRDFIGNPKGRAVVFVNRKAEIELQGTLFFDEQSTSAFLLLVGTVGQSQDATTPPRSYVLRAVLEDQTRIEVRRFTLKPPVTGVRCDNLDPAFAAVTHWEIAEVDGGSYLLSTA